MSFLFSNPSKRTKTNFGVTCLKKHTLRSSSFNPKGVNRSSQQATFPEL